MYWSPTQAVLNVYYVCKYLEQFPEKLGVLRDGSCMNGRAKVDSAVMLNEVVLFELINQWEIPNQEIVMILREVEWIAIRSIEKLPEEKL